MGSLRSRRWRNLESDARPPPSVQSRWRSSGSCARSCLGLIQREREARGLTQEQLADKAGIHWTTVGKIERGKQIPSVALLAVLARGLDVDLMDLLAPALPPGAGAPGGDDEDALAELTRTLPKPERRKLLPVIQALLRWKEGQ